MAIPSYPSQEYRCGQGCAPVTAPTPPRLIPGGRYSVDFAVHVALMKYGFHLSLARQERLYGREGLRVEAQTLWDQLEALARHLQKSYEALGRGAMRLAVRRPCEHSLPTRRKKGEGVDTASPQPHVFCSGGERWT